MTELWKTALEKEREWWAGCTDTSDEEFKQRTYATQMGLDKYLSSNKGALVCGPSLTSELEMFVLYFP